MTKGINEIHGAIRQQRADRLRTQRAIQNFQGFFERILCPEAPGLLEKELRGVSRNGKTIPVHALPPAPTEHGYLSIVETFERSSAGTRRRIEVRDYEQLPIDLWNEGIAIGGRNTEGHLWLPDGPVKTEDDLHTLVVLTDTVLKAAGLQPYGPSSSPAPLTA